ERRVRKAAPPLHGRAPQVGSHHRVGQRRPLQDAGLPSRSQLTALWLSVPSPLPLHDGRGVPGLRAALRAARRGVRGLPGGVLAPSPASAEGGHRCLKPASDTPPGPLPPKSPPRSSRCAASRNTSPCRLGSWPRSSTGGRLRP